MNKKTILSSATAVGLALGGGGGFKIAKDAGREEILGPMRHVPGQPLSGQHVILKRDTNAPSVFAVASPDISPELFKRLTEQCPTNQWIVIAGRGVSK